MSQITLENGRISFYGNPAGYLQKEKAVVDTLFQGEELSQWLERQNLTPQWTDGVMERLIGGDIEMGEDSTPLKNVRVWQLNPTVDVGMKFVSLKDMESGYGSPSIQNYHAVYDGQLGTNNLEDIYTRCNIDHPHGYSGHSMSMSDVVELYDEGGSEFHYCDHFGFQQIDFAEQTQNQTMSMSL